SSPAAPDAGTASAPAHSSAIALTRDGATLFVVNPDADSVSVVDTKSRSLVREILLAPAHPAPDASGAYAPAVMPRAVALSPDEKTLFVSGERSSRLHAIDVASGAVTSSATLCSEPVGVVVSSDGAAIFVACSQDASVVRVDAKTLAPTATAHVGNELWALAWSGDGATLFATHFLNAAVDAIDPTTMAVRSTSVVPD